MEMQLVPQNVEKNNNTQSTPTTNGMSSYSIK